MSYYDRQNRPLDLMSWARLFEDKEYSRIATTDIDSIRVSTVWLGLDQNWRPPPLIFETMVFDDGTTETIEIAGYTHHYSPPMDEFSRRYTTEAQALSGHDQVVAEIREMLKSVRGVGDMGRDAQRPPD